MKSHYFIFCLIVFMCFTSCVSETEENGVREVANIFGNTNITTGVSASTDKISGKFVELKITNSDFFKEKSELDYEAISGGAALVFYRNLNKEEREKYKRYDIELSNGAGTTQENSLSAELIKKLFEKEKVAQYYVRRLFQKDYAYINNHMLYRFRVDQDSCKSLFQDLEKYVQSTDKPNVILAQNATIDISKDEKAESFFYRFNVTKDTTTIGVKIFFDTKDSLLGINYTIN